MPSKRSDKRLVCGKCGDDKFKSYKKPRNYFNPKCNDCDKRNDCYICSSCHNAFCEMCSLKSKNQIDLLTQNLKQKNPNKARDAITAFMQYPNLHKNDNFQDIIKSLMLFDNSEIITFYHQSMDNNKNIKQQRLSYTQYMQSNLFDSIIKLDIHPSILKECLNYLDCSDIIFKNKVIHEMIDEYFLKNVELHNDTDDEKEGQETINESNRLLKCIILCVTHNPKILNQCNYDYPLKPIFYVFINYYKYKNELKYFMESLGDIINVQKHIDLFELICIFFNKNTLKKDKLSIVKCLPLVFTLYPELLLSKNNKNENLLSFSESLKNILNNDDDAADLIQILSDKDALQEFAKSMFNRHPEYKQRNSIDWIMEKEPEPVIEDEKEEKEGIPTNIKSNKVQDAYVLMPNDDGSSIIINAHQQAIDNLKKEAHRKYGTKLLLRFFFVYLLLFCIQIGSSIVQFLLLYTDSMDAGCLLDSNISKSQYEIEAISLLVLTVLPLIFIILFLKSTERTIQYVLVLIILIIIWFVMFSLSIYSYTIWDNNVSCSNNEWYWAMNILFMIWFILYSLITLIILCYYMKQLVTKLVNNIDPIWAKEVGIGLAAGCVQITACIMQLVLVFSDNICILNNKNMDAYKVESISLFILSIAAFLLIIARILPKQLKYVFCGILFFIIYGLSIHSYTIWDNYMQCNKNSYRIGMITLFIIWFSQQTIILFVALIYLIRDFFKDKDIDSQSILIIFSLIFVFCCQVVIPLVSSLLQIIYIANNDCNGNGINLVQPICLFILTIMLFLLLICFAFLMKNNQEQSIQSISIMICAALLWFIQFGLVNTAFEKLETDRIKCDPHSIHNALYGLFLSWVIIDSIIFTAACIAAIVISCIEIGPKYIAFGSLILCQAAIYVVAPILQMILITDDECSGDLVSISETIFLIIFEILQCCFAIFLMNDDRKTMWVVGCCEFMLFVAIYIFVINSVNTWGSGQVQCGTKDDMKTAAFVLFLIWMIEYTIYILGACIGAVCNYADS